MQTSSPPGALIGGRSHPLRCPALRTRALATAVALAPVTLRAQARFPLPIDTEQPQRLVEDIRAFFRPMR